MLSASRRFDCAEGTCKWATLQSPGSVLDQAEDWNDPVPQLQSKQSQAESVWIVSLAMVTTHLFASQFKATGAS